MTHRIIAQALSMCSILIGHGQITEPDLYVERNPMTQSYNRIHAAYELGFYKEDLLEKPVKANGFGIGFTHGFSLSKEVPLFIEAGVTGHFGFYRETADFIVLKSRISSDLLSASIPVSFAYKIANGKEFCFEPFLGASARVNLLADYKVKMTAPFHPEIQGQIDRMTPHEFYELCGIWPYFSAFDKDKVGKHEVWQRFQCGLHAGFNLQFRAVSLGAWYTYYLTDLSESTRLSFFNVSIGYNFSAK